jgi:hypothetical protein
MDGQLSVDLKCLDVVLWWLPFGRLTPPQPWPELQRREYSSIKTR